MRTSPYCLIRAEERIMPSNFCAAGLFEQLESMAGRLTEGRHYMYRPGDPIPTPAISMGLAGIFDEAQVILQRAAILGRRDFALAPATAP